MPTYIWVGNFTEQGVRTIKDSIKRADAIKSAAKKFGVSLSDIHWTMGQFDVIVTFEAKDDTSMSAFALSVAMAGNVRGQTMRAYTKEEMTGLLGKL